ncbi:MAG: pth [Rickettsiaceae bacterium]|jgi:PTH1 family peptidyl-tRNA hydrolase|nr:pth [Rickettsiaceae bacterium]
MKQGQANFEHPNGILIVGLGNPGTEYQYTRHNIGFLVIDAIANRYNFPSFSNSIKFSAEICQGTISGQKIFLAKPTTYMNLSGASVQKIKSYYKLDIADIIVIHDDIDLDFSKLKVKIGGGHGGHNGLRSIDGNIGKDYLRIRFGVGRPISKEDVADYVLNNFSKVEMLQARDLIERIAVNIPHLFVGATDKFFRNL